MEITSNKGWIKYVVGGIVFAVGIGLLFLDQTKTFAPFLIGIGLGMVISH